MCIVVALLFISHILFDTLQHYDTKFYWMQQYIHTFCAHIMFSFFIYKILCIILTNLPFLNVLLCVLFKKQKFPSSEIGSPKENILVELIKSWNSIKIQVISLLLTWFEWCNCNVCRVPCNWALEGKESAVLSSFVHSLAMLFVQLFKFTIFRCSHKCTLELCAARF